MVGGYTHTILERFGQCLTDLGARNLDTQIKSLYT